MRGEGPKPYARHCWPVLLKPAWRGRLKPALPPILDRSIFMGPYSQLSFVHCALECVPGLLEAHAEAVCPRVLLCLVRLHQRRPQLVGFMALERPGGWMCCKRGISDFGVLSTALKPHQLGFWNKTKSAHPVVCNTSVCPICLEVWTGGLGQAPALQYLVRVRNRHES